MTLFDGKPGKEYKVAGIKGGGEARQRLLDLGFVRGTAIRICNVAPFKVTMLVSLRGYLLAVRKETGESIAIREIEIAASPAAPRNDSRRGR